MSANKAICNFMSDILTEVLNDEDVGFVEAAATKYVERYKLKKVKESKPGLEKTEFFSSNYDIATLMTDCTGTPMQFPVIHELNNLYQDYQNDHPIIIAKAI